MFPCVQCYQYLFVHFTWTQTCSQLGAKQKSGYMAFIVIIIIYFLFFCIASSSSLNQFYSLIHYSLDIFKTAQHYYNGIWINNFSVNKNCAHTHQSFVYPSCFVCNFSHSLSIFPSLRIIPLYILTYAKKISTEFANRGD